MFLLLITLFILLTLLFGLAAAALLTDAFRTQTEADAAIEPEPTRLPETL